MKITTTARHYELTPALRDYAEKKVFNLKKYFDQIVNAHITFSLEKYRHAVEIKVHVNGRDFKSREESEDMYASIDRAVDKLERQILKHKGKMKSRKTNFRIADLEYEAPVEESDEKATPIPAVVMADRSSFPKLTLKEAMDEMKKRSKEFHIFVNPLNDRICILFVKGNGTYGLLEAREHGE